MNTQADLPNIVSEYFKNIADTTRLDSVGMFLCRMDGVVLFSETGNMREEDVTHIGALLGGVWQAASALAAFMPNNNLQDQFRLSFDTASRGIYILPVEHEEKVYYMGFTYQDEINPGLVKAKARVLALKLCEYLEKNYKAIIIKSESKADFLFSDITDSEMDQLFPFS